MNTQTSPTDNQILGLVAETLTLEPKELTNKFILLDEPITGGVGKTLVEEIFEEGHRGTLSDHMHLLTEKARDVNYGQNWKAETLEKKLMENYEEYFKMLQSDKTVVQPDIYEEAKVIAKGWMGNEVVKKFLDKAARIQEKLVGEIKGELCHGTPDFCAEDDISIRICDLKVVSIPPRVAARKYRWDIQGSFYQTLLAQNMTVSEYKEIKAPVFIVSERGMPEYPLVFELSQDSLISGTAGTDHKEGYMQLLDRYKWHKEHDLWDYRKEYYENKGLLKLTVV